MRCRVGRTPPPARVYPPHCRRGRATARQRRAPAPAAHLTRGCASHRLVQWRELGLDRGAARLEEGRQHQRAAKLARRLVDRKAWLIGRDLEQDAVRLAEIDRAKVIPVLL